MKDLAHTKKTASTPNRTPSYLTTSLSLFSLSREIFSFGGISTATTLSWAEEVFLVGTTYSIVLSLNFFLSRILTFLLFFIALPAVALRLKSVLLPLLMPSLAPRSCFRNFGSNHHPILLKVLLPPLSRINEGPPFNFQNAR